LFLVFLLHRMTSNEFFVEMRYQYAYSQIYLHQPILSPLLINLTLDDFEIRDLLTEFLSVNPSPNINYKILFFNISVNQSFFFSFCLCNNCFLSFKHFRSNFCIIWTSHYFIFIQFTQVKNITISIEDFHIKTK